MIVDAVFVRYVSVWCIVPGRTHCFCWLCCQTTHQYNLGHKYVPIEIQIKLLTLLKLG